MVMDKKWFDNLCHMLACCNGLASYEGEDDPIVEKPTPEQEEGLRSVAYLCKDFLSIYEYYKSK